MDDTGVRDMSFAVKVVFMVLVSLVLWVGIVCLVSWMLGLGW